MDHVSRAISWSALHQMARIRRFFYIVRPERVAILKRSAYARIVRNPDLRLTRPLLQ
jgi:hypothetical protein